MNGNAIQRLNQLYVGVSDVRLRECGIAAIRSLAPQATATAAPLIYFRAWLAKFLSELDPSLPLNGGPPGSVTINDMLDWSPTQGQHAQPRNLKPLHFWQWMVRADFAVAFPNEAWGLTATGVARLASDHPCRPGALQRLRAAAGSDYEDSLNRIDDSLSCLEAGLARPAAVLLGLAYEELVSVVLARIEGKTSAQLKGTASDRLEQLRKALLNRTANDARAKALLALGVADTIRGERNKAAHQATGDWDLVDTESLVAAGIGVYASLACYHP